VPLWRRKTRVSLSPTNVAADWQGGAWRHWPPPRNFVVGESHYGDALTDLSGPICEGGYCLPVEVIFVREPANPYDANALRADVQGRIVGHLAREMAAQLSPVLDRARVVSFGVCGVIRGGSHGAPNVGVHVWLDRRTGPGPEISVEDDAGEVAWPPHEHEISTP
jgi:hypothetical protein